MFFSTSIRMKISLHLPYSVFLEFLLYDISYCVLTIGEPETYDI